ncbi:hypothetical protein EPO15_04190 [bacterium]|nr:MAG: hypothetical protein EPO15_04190 [bacterium]
MSPAGARLTAFASGAAVLILELVGTRLVSPVFGSTLYVWSALICVTLAALAVGAWVGGGLADGPRPEPWPARLCAAAGLWLLAVPFARRPVLLAASALGLKAGVLTAAAVLVGPPLMALGCLGPLCVRASAGSWAALGRAAGGVSALSTGGSVLGALAAGFWLLPLLSAPVVVCAVGGALLAGAACMRFSPPRAGPAAVGALLAAALAARARPALGSPTSVVRAAEDSLYGAVRVVDRLDWGRRVLYIDGVANTVSYFESFESSSDYIHAYELAAAGRPLTRRALVVGLGGGAIVGRLANGWRVPADAVEVDPTVARLAARWFGFRPTGELWLEDGRCVLEREGARYGLIYLDAFSGDQNPEHLFTVEAFSAARRRLEPGGLLVVNLIGYAEGPRAGLARAAKRTLSEVFPKVDMLVANRNSDWRSGVSNLVFYAGDAALDPVAGVAGRPELEEYWAAVAGQWVDPGPGGRLLTDDSGALTALGAPGMAEMRAAMLARGEGVDL